MSLAMSLDDVGKPKSSVATPIIAKPPKYVTFAAGETPDAIRKDGEPKPSVAT
jgi:hypothetical protein